MSCMPTPGPTHLIVSSTPAGPFRTPSMSMAKKRKLMEPELSGISSSDQENQGTKESHYLSGVEDIEACAVEKSSSFINPFDITIDTTGQFGMEDDSSDEDYQPSFCFNDRPDFALQIEDDTEHEEGTEETNTMDESDGPELHLGHGVMRVTLENMDSFLSDTPFLVYKNCLMKLVQIKIPASCQHCQTPIEMKSDVVGSALYFSWVCQNGHVTEKWCSQPLMNRRLHSGDLMLSAASLLSGNNYQKISAFAKVLKLPFVNPSTYHRIQRSYLVPSIDNFWDDHQTTILNQYRGKDVVVLGDGRMDSPGHCAQYCSYTFMEMESKTILCIITLDKRMTEKKSTNLEKACFEKGMKFLKDSGINIVEVVTDAHVQIAALMKKPQYANIRHSFDIWHGTKNLGKKIIKVSQEKGQKNKPLLDWTKDVVNHYWHCATISDTTEKFQTTWYGILHHVVNEHEWVASYERSDVSNARCSHGPLPQDSNKHYLEKGSDAHNALRNIVMDKRLNNNIHYYLECRSTSDLETFQNLILAYASKRHAYTPPVYRARNRLAALDHNNHLTRQVAVKEDGSQRYRRNFNKKSARWSVQPIKEKKTFPHIPEIVRTIVTMRLEDNIGMNQNVILEVDDPRRVSRNIAPVAPQPTLEILENQRSRFVDLDKTIDYVYEASDN